MLAVVDDRMSKRRGRPPRRVERIEATPETRAKLTRDPLFELMLAEQREEGSGLTSDQWGAAIQIREAYEILTAPVALRLHRYEPEIASGRSEWGRRASALVEAYCDWGDAVHRRGLSVIRILDMLHEDRPVELETLRVALDLWPHVRY